MIHVATAHFRSPRWIEVQTRALRESLSEEHRIWGSLEGIDPGYGRYFDRVLDQYGPHAGKLNHFALEIGAEAAADDLLMFLDGDAFPVADPVPFLRQNLERYPLIAVQRAELLSEPQPHPCFCVTSVRTWRELRGDWSPGYPWTGARGRPVSDVGGNLLRALELSGTPWLPLLRSGGRTEHPLFFGTYGGLIYHHGAGFRGAVITRLDRDDAPRRLAVPGLAGRLVNGSRWRLWERRVAERNRESSERIYAELSAA